MEISMLWFDNDPATELDTKVASAAKYYASKYGEIPNLCFIHPSSLMENAKSNIDDLELISSFYVLPHHFWIGRGKENIR